MSTEERFSELWTDYLEGELEDAGVAELSELLSADDERLQLAADLYQTHRMLGLLGDENEQHCNEFVADTLARLPKKQDHFVNDVLQSLQQVSGAKQVAPAKSAQSAGGNSRFAWVFAASLALLVLVVLGVFIRPGRRPAVVGDDTDSAELDGHEVALVDATAGKVRFISSARAQFFGELPPPVHATPALNREYVLMSGDVEVEFPSGATAIIGGPAVFRVRSNDCLALDAGRCSVHAPEGAEGFRVETPVAQVVDRGTRFAVSVNETSETEVQVIEGAADIFRHSDDAAREIVKPDLSDSTFEMRLTSSQAQKFGLANDFASDAIPFDPSTYQLQLPDRVISYEATKTASGRAKKLTSVTVQRGGTPITVLVDDLIPAEVTSFSGLPGLAFLAGGKVAPDSLKATSYDQCLNTGVINPGGSVEPLTSSPITESSNPDNLPLTPGMAIQFESPVVNGPGPDIVLFDVQTYTNPSDGDAFHVSPLEFRDGLKSLTVRVFDLTMVSAAALELDEFYVHIYSEQVNSVAMLETAQRDARKSSAKFRGLAVGIDLSDLGYAPGESVVGLFIQDAMDDKNAIDPVFIGGLPSVSEESQ